MPWLLGRVAGDRAFFCSLFFTGVQRARSDAAVPDLALAPPGVKGTAIGVYSSVQFLGTFVGAACGGFMSQHFGARGVFVFDFALLLAVAACWPPGCARRCRC